MPENSNKPEARPKRKRHRLQALLILILILLGLALWINGPGSRWFLRKAITEQLASQGLEGSTILSGQLWSGYQLEETSFTGSGPLRSFKLDHLSFRYRISSLLQKKIDLVEVRGMRVTFYPEPSGKEDWKHTFQTLCKLHPLIAPTQIELRDIVVHVHSKGQEAQEISLDSLSHAPGSEAFVLNGFSAKGIFDKPIPKQDLSFNWASSSLSLAEFTIVPELGISNLTVKFTDRDPITASAEVGLAGSTLSISASENGNAQLKLSESPLDLASLTEPLALSQPLTGLIQHLDVTATDLLGPPSQWQASIAIETQQVSWQQRQLPDVVLNADLSPQSWKAQLRLASEALTLNLDTPAPPENAKQEHWQNLPVVLSLECPSLASALDIYQRASGNELTDTLPSGALSATGVITLGSEHTLQQANLDWHGTELKLNEHTIPDLKGTVSLDGQSLALTTTRRKDPADEELALEAQYHLTQKTYQATAAIKLKESQWLGPLLIPERPTMHPVGPLILRWSGSGSLQEATHRGSYHLETLTAKILDETTTHASIKGSYQWPGSIKAESIAIRNEQLKLTGGITWTPKRTTFQNLKLTDGDGVLATINGSGPGGKEIINLPGAGAPFDLKIQAKELSLARLRELLPVTLDPAYRASFDADLSLTGTPNNPKLNGSFSTTGILTSNEKIPPLAITTNFKTSEGRLQLNGSLIDPSGQIAILEANIPVETEKWADDPTLLEQIPISANARAKNLSLDRLQIFAPALKDAEGHLDLDLTLTGTTSKPVYQGSAVTLFKKFPLPNTPYRAIRDTKISLRFDKDRITLEPSSTTIAGGKLVLSGQVELTGPEPVLDFRLDANDALLWRNDILIARSTGQLNLNGPWSSARLSGQLGLVDSLFYKDIQIISLNDPRSTVHAPELPKFTKGNIPGLSFELPAPLSDWPVDIQLTTKDPFLLRGNRANGEANGEVWILGTLSRPRPEGRIALRDAELILPFSTLKVSRGSILLRPEFPHDPILEFYGRSSVNSTAINIHVFGPVSNPKYNMHSDPPLPESELLALLATGATTADLEDPYLARMLLFQLLVEETRRKANSNTASPTLKMFRKPLNAADQLNLRMAENDPFSGRKFNSATMELTDKWAGVMQIDDEGHTRGLLRYSIRFK